MNRLDTKTEGKGEGDEGAPDKSSFDGVKVSIRNIRYWAKALFLFFPTMGGDVDLPEKSPLFGIKIEDMTAKQLADYKRWAADRNAVRARICRIMDALDV